MSVIERPISRTVGRLRNLIAATVAPALGGRQTAAASRVALPASAHRAAERTGAGASAAGGGIGGLAAAADVVGAARPLAAAGVNTVAPPPPPDTIVAWLARAALLCGMPFEYITPDGRMLPKESLRFFYIDANWQNSLIDGAVSVGLSSSADSIQVMATIETLVAQAIQQTSAVRPALRGAAAVAAAADTVTTGPITGLLLRSAVVSGWPGMEVSAYADDAATRKLKALRIERLSEDVLICLFDGLPRQVNFLQPPEGLHFGVRPTGDGPAGYMTFLRGLGYGGHDAGIQIDSRTAPVTMRGGNARPGVVDMATTAVAVKAALQQLTALDSKGTFTAAEFAVQMVRAAGMQSFQWTAPVPATPAPATPAIVRPDAS